MENEPKKQWHTEDYIQGFKEASQVVSEQEKEIALLKGKLANPLLNASDETLIYVNLLRDEIENLKSYQTLNELYDKLSEQSQRIQELTKENEVLRATINKLMADIENEFRKDDFHQKLP